MAERSVKGKGAAQPFTAVHIMAKASGAVCNLDCAYCYYLEKEKLFPSEGAAWRMSEETLELFVRQYVEAQDAPEVSFGWQGGEPTLMGLAFYKKAVALQKRYAGGKTIHNSLQTNGTLLDDAWGEFLARNRFLVGISIDGPRELHDRYRLDKGGKPTFDRVMQGLETLKRHQVEFNTLTTVHPHNERSPLEVYRFLKEIGSGFVQFIPIVERAAEIPDPDGLTLVFPTFPGKAAVSRWSVSPSGYGGFLCAVFDEWVRGDVGRVFVQMFDVSLGAWLGMEPSLCIFSETCGNAPVIEHNGDLYACDHFVYPDYRLGNVRERSIREMVESPEQRSFGEDKRDRLPRRCRECPVLFACHGGCPKHRFARTPDGEEGLNYLCPAYERFFTHVDPYMRVMAAELAAGRPATGVMDWVREQDLHRSAMETGRNDPCPCGSGRKFKHCHGRADV
ncbi:MAG: anaerobic sulfatase-maturation protein [Gemmatimonadota bacterium]